MIKKSKGFSLIEVIVATAITAIIATSIAFLFTQSIVTNTDAKEKQIASKISQNRIEQLRNMPFADMLNQTENITVSDLPGGHRITTIKTCYGTDIREAEVEVTWTAKEGQKSLKLNTLIYNK